MDRTGATRRGERRRLGLRLAEPWPLRPALAALLMALIAISATPWESVRANSGGTSFPLPTAPDGRWIVGCTSSSGLTFNGPRSRRTVALTFDDGPSLRYTPRILEILNRAKVKATFFILGKHVRGRVDLLREMLRSGHEIANHSFRHPEYPGGGELRVTNRLIRTATGFTPCQFRPPYGLVNGKVLTGAARNGLRTVLWDVESLDSRHPGAPAVRANVLNYSQPGSIVLMHDGGKHPETVAALPGILAGMRARGFNFTTVTQLLGGRFRHRARPPRQLIE
jgi:peptidoglycan/xylan/chitin deacetylase (PgdA/CDA1 family)